MASRKDYKKSPLYRKVNTKTRGVRHNHGGDYRHSRRKDSKIGMRQGIQRGLDYTPLFKFLLSHVGEKWSEVHSEAISRLDKEDPIFWLVHQSLDGAPEVVRVGESSYFSGMYIDDEGVLQLVNKNFSEETLKPTCSCCTHTLNGVVFTQKHEE